jgi:transcriptional pleiotropic repressor
MKDLLVKTRNLNRMLQKGAGNPVDFGDMAVVLTEMLNCNTYIISSKGKILGVSFLEEFNCEIVDQIVMEKRRFDESFNDYLLSVKDTQANLKNTDGLCTFSKSEKCPLGGKIFCIIPIIGGGKRQGTLLISKNNSSFDEADLILSEYGATVVGMEIIRAKAEEIEEEARKKAAVSIAIGTLSYSERDAIKHIFEELKGTEGFLVASKVADRVGITRSVIVNALRKFESAGVIESKSLGMKGTYILVLNDYLPAEIDKLK